MPKNWVDCALALLAIAVFFIAVEAHADCNCVTYSVNALKSIHIRLRTLPSIGVNDWFRHPGAYARGVANVRDIEDCHTLLHEFVHHAQWLKYGDALSLHENWQREMDAAQITMVAEREYGAPICEP